MKRIQQLVLLLSVLLVTLTGCRESLTEEAVAPRGVAVEIAVRPDGMQEQTRSTDEDAINDLNFYLYDDQGSLLLHRYQQATTLRFEVVPGHYRMRLAANLGRDLGENPSEEELRISNAESYERLPMAAEEEFDVTSAGASCSTIEVRRCVAKVSYEIDVKDSNIELRSVQLISLPRTAALFEPEAAPSSNPSDYTDGSETTLTGTAASGVCYLLLNLQGTVPSITDQRQKSPEHAPEHASYLLIRAANGSRNLLYTVYLGGNNTSDFNVRANVHYTFRISILGDDEIDTRVYSYSIQVWDNFDDYRFGDYCIYEGTTLLHIDVENNDEELPLTGKISVTAGDSSKVLFDDFHGESGPDFKVYNPNGANLFGVQYNPTVYTSSNSRFAYRITLRDSYGVCGTYDFEHRMANVVYVNPSAGGTISASGALWSGDTGSGSSLRSVALCYEQGCSLTARAGAGYQFEGWYSDSGCTQRLSTSATYAFRPEQARTELYARFKSTITPLDGNGTANCYIARKLNTTYSFDATVQGNGRSTPNVTPQKLSGVEARILWETGAVRNAVIRSAEYADGRICFETGTAHGNAVIGLFDAAGTCIWSWHIWAVDYDPLSTAKTYSTGAVFMDRNLGAESTATSDVVSKGLYFQWGRKDPFIYPKENRKSDNKTPATTWNLQGYEFEVHSHYTGNYPLSDYSIAWSLEHPTSFIGSAPNPAGSNPVYFSTWLVDYSPYLWGYPSGKKTIYDPCPPGWKVPASSAWDKTVFKKASGITSWGWYMYYNGTATSFYPFNGYLEDSSGTLQYYVPASWTRIWTSDPSSSGAQTAKSVDVLDSGVVQIATGNSQTHGHGVRCVKE